MITQNPGGKVSPANVVSEGEDEHLMLAGHDVVSYHGRHPPDGRPGNQVGLRGSDLPVRQPEHK
ncbi:MAG: hypothetical protein R3E68_01330 [Burkholderiaceae bacterium]